MTCFESQLKKPNLENKQNFQNIGLKEDLEIFLKFQLGASKFQFKVSFLNFDISDQSFEVRACLNCSDYNWQDMVDLLKYSLGVRTILPQGPCIGRKFLPTSRDSRDFDFLKKCSWGGGEM